MIKKGLDAYRNVGNTEVLSASPHRIVQMLFEAAISQLAKAKQAIETSNIPARGKAISNVLAIVAQLRAGLDFEKGDKIAENLERLYIFVEEHLIEANIQGSVQHITEAEKVISAIKAGWDAIPAELQQTQPQA